MKKRVIIFLLFGLFCLITVWGEGNDNTSSWMRVYTTGRQPLTTYPEGIPIDPAGYLVGTDVVVSPEGNIMVAAYVGDPGSPDLPPARTALGCLTSDGSIVWSREYFPIEPPKAFEPQYSPFGFGVWAQLEPYSNEDNVAFALTFANNLLLLNTEGIVLHSYHFPEITHLTNLLTLPDGGLVMVGIGSSSPFTGDSSPVGVQIFRLTFSSQEDPIILWARKINGLVSKIQTPYPRPEVVYTMNEDGNNYLWVGAAGGFLICLSEDGNLLGTWRLDTKKGTKIHNNHGQVRYLQYGALATDQQGQLFFGGSLGVKSSYTSAFSQFSLITCLTSDPTKLNLVWASTLTENTGYGLGSSIHDLQLLGGDLFITGDTSLWGQDEGNFNRAAYAARLSVDGSVAWVRLLGRKKQSEMQTEYSDELGHSIALTGDGGAVLVGGASSFSHPEPWRQMVKEAMTIHPELLVVRLGPGGEVGNIGFGRYPNLGLAPELGDRSTQVDVLAPELTLEEANLTTEEITVSIETISFGTRDGGWVERGLRGQRNPGDQPPVAVIHLLNKEDQFWENIVWFDGSASYDPEGGYIIRYQWDFGDGKTYTSTSPQVSHKYTSGNKYKVTLTVTDEQGFTASKSISIVVGNTLSYQGKRKINIGIPAALIVSDEKLVNYLIEITTGDVQDAGTDSFVYLALFGPEKDNGRYGSGEMNPYNAFDPYGPFERGNTDSFNNQGYNLDEVEFMTLRHNNSYDKPGWYVEAIKIKNTYNNKEWLFVPNQWLAMDEPPEYQTWGKFYPIRPHSILFKWRENSWGMIEVSDHIFILPENTETFYFQVLNYKFNLEVYRQEFLDNGTINQIFVGNQSSTENPQGLAYSTENITKPTRFLIKIKEGDTVKEELYSWVFPNNWKDHKNEARKITLLYPLKGSTEIFLQGEVLKNYLTNLSVDSENLCEPIITYGADSLKIFGSVPDEELGWYIKTAVEKYAKDKMVKILATITGKTFATITNEIVEVLDTLYKAAEWASKLDEVIQISTGKVYKIDLLKDIGNNNVNFLQSLALLEKIKEKVDLLISSVENNDLWSCTYYLNNIQTLTVGNHPDSENKNDHIINYADYGVTPFLKTSTQSCHSFYSMVEDYPLAIILADELSNIKSWRNSHHGYLDAYFAGGMSQEEINAALAEVGASPLLGIDTLESNIGLSDEDKNRVTNEVMDVYEPIIKKILNISSLLISASLLTN